MTYKTLRIDELSGGASINSQGDVLYQAIVPLLEGGSAVELDFTNINSLTSSYLNSSFGRLIAERGYGFIKGKVRFSHLPPGLLGSVKNYFDGIKDIHA